MTITIPKDIIARINPDTIPESQDMKAVSSIMGVDYDQKDDIQLRADTLVLLLTGTFKMLGIDTDDISIEFV